MRRRSLLRAVGAGAAGLAGCLGGPGGGDTATPTPPLARRGEPADLCEREVVDLGIAAIVDPAFAAAGAAGLADDHPVVGVERDGTARAYPLGVLAEHEVVNDRLPDGTPLLVTYCPVCDSGMVAERRVAGRATAFGVSGQVWQPPGTDLGESEADGRVFALDPDDPEGGRVRRDGALVMYDAATGSYWSQVLARAVCGPRRGDRLRIVPSTTARWADWRRAHPDTAVLRGFPASAAGNPPAPGVESSTPRPPQ